MTSYIYFVQARDDGPIKIGTTRSHPKKRLSHIQTGCPWPITLLGVIEGDVCREKEFHATLAPYRTNGEWFSPHAIVKDAIAQAIETGKTPIFDMPWAPRYSHPLHLWLCKNRIRAIEFAARIGVTTSLITSWYREDAWIGKEVAQAIYRETNGEITPNDFLFYMPEAAQ
jgi:hypothetical protein